jgi:hypothetical protein
MCAMRVILCTHCHRRTDEADEGWDRALKTGTCPRCGRMLDATTEARAEVAASDPAIRRRARILRVAALVTGLGALVGGGALMLLGAELRVAKLAAPVLAFGLAEIGFALFYRSRDEARQELKKPTNLERFVERR